MPSSKFSGRRAHPGTPAVWKSTPNPLPPPLPPPPVTWSVTASGSTPAYYITATHNGCNPSLAAGSAVTVNCTIFPALWQTGHTNPTNCLAAGNTYWTGATPGTTYTITAQFNWPDGKNCTANATSTA